jgi:hypothetical protein
MRRDAEDFLDDRIIEKEAIPGSEGRWKDRR